MAEERWSTEVTLDHLEMMALLIALEYVKEDTGGRLSEPEQSAQGKLRAAMKPFWEEMSERIKPVGRSLPEPTVEDEYGPAN